MADGPRPPPSGVSARVLVTGSDSGDERGHPDRDARLHGDAAARDLDGLAGQLRARLTSNASDEGHARCTTVAEARARLGQVCTVVGTYQLEEFTSKKAEVFRTWPVVVFPGDAGTVALESLWDESKLPDPAEIERWRGRTVEVRGKLHGSPPSEERFANFSQLTISPVDAIRLAP